MFVPKTEAALKMLAALPPSPVWSKFLRCTEIPRGSYNTEEFRKELMTFGQTLGLETLSDPAGNVLIRKPGSKGFESRPSVCLQAHFDMVCSSDDPNFDFKTSAIQTRIVPAHNGVEGPWLMATGTSLGADNGIGLCSILSVLEDNSLVHPPLEALFTNDEEVGLVGASELSLPLKSLQFVNLDDEEEGGLCIGCSGGFRTSFSLPITREPIANGVVYNVKLTGLRGGHSGMDINKNHGNAIKLFGRILNHAHTKAPFGILSSQAINPTNVIPRECSAKVVVPANKCAEFESRIDEMFSSIRKEYQTTESSIALEMAKDTAAAAAATLPTSVASTTGILTFLTLVPFGVMRMSPDIPDLVETSSNVASIDLQENVCEFSGSSRSSSGSQLDDVYLQLKTIATLLNCNISERLNLYPGWLPNPKSPLLSLMKKVYREVGKREPRVYAIHAGLECGIIQSKFPGMDCIAFGPQIESPHSPSERVLIASVDRAHQLVVGLLKELAHQQ